VLGSADIATFTTDVMQLSLDQYASNINFGGLLQDSAGNIMVDDNGSKLILRDSLPPMVASSNYAVSADQMTTVLTIVFNEANQPETFTDVLPSGVLLPSFDDRFGFFMSDLFELNAPGFDIGDGSSIVAISEENALRVNFTLKQNGTEGEIGVVANISFSNLLANNVFSRFDNNDSVETDSTVAIVALRQAQN
jgi:hypothetical protein